MSRFRVVAYRDDLRGSFYDFYYQNEAKAKDKRAELLATLPAAYNVEIREMQQQSQ